MHWRVFNMWWTGRHPFSCSVLRMSRMPPVDRLLELLGVVALDAIHYV